MVELLSLVGYLLQLLASLALLLLCIFYLVHLHFIAATLCFVGALVATWRIT